MPDNEIFSPEEVTRESFVDRIRAADTTLEAMGILLEYKNSLK
jgi:hypothetical protein